MNGAAMRVVFQWGDYVGAEVFRVRGDTRRLDDFTLAQRLFFRLVRQLGAAHVSYVCEGTIRVYDGPAITSFERIAR